MLHGGAHSSVQSPTDADNRESQDAALEIAITPLAMPILAGPGTIATAMNYASAGGVAEFIITAGAFAALCVISYGFFVSGERFVTRIGANGVKVITRLMGLILAVIGVQMLIEGIGGAIKAFQASGVG
jgi:multiple antibiotic resistance protein